jgi:hypothetical protein
VGGGPTAVVVWTGDKIVGGALVNAIWSFGGTKGVNSYVLIDVEPGQKTRFTLTRYRPGSAEPFATEALFA